MEKSVSVILEEWGIIGKRVVFLVPNAYLVFRYEKIPRAISNDDIKGYLYLEFGASITFLFLNFVLIMSRLVKRMLCC
ncbi:hypothetical protein IQ283_07070 [Alkalihalobacillus hwajinpoensis]|uniref:hypothetical protein n=1 Tax=Guptibacillus hwajinpoensis TaxID=208199 RepID=UPI001883349E|nr:hypothetical protein [Pseudalkalibacillus hwajinpoensis]MBF0706370.1 hypothetical protein [Pseudalkalibacillus hwajinpoensis]